MLLNQAYQLFRFDKECYCTKKTIVYYDDNVPRFINYIADKNSVSSDLVECDAVNRDIILSYIANLRASGIKNTSVNTYFRAVKSFINYCIDENYVDDNVLHKIKFLKSDQEPIIPLYNWEVDILDGLFNSKSETGLRNLCIIHLMIDAGFRCSDVINLKYSNISFNNNYLIVQGKGNKFRSVPLAPELKKMLYRYLVLYRKYDHNDDYYVFTKIGSEEPINNNVIKQLFFRIKKSSEIERLHPHLLRHTFATSYILGGGNLEFLRMMLGHSDYETTKLYLHLAQQAKMLQSDIYHLNSIFFRSIY